MNESAARLWPSRSSARLWSRPQARACAQSWPARPLRLVVPFPAGGSADLLGRTLAKQLGEGLGQQVLVENRAGAGGTIGATAVARAPADGYTLGLGTVSTLGMAPVVRKDPPYESLAAFAPISLVASAPFVLVVNAGVPAKHRSASWSRSRGRIPAGSTSPRSAKARCSISPARASRRSPARRMVHVPYKGVAPALVDLLSGQVQLMFDVLASFQVQNVQSGRLRALAVLGPSRVAQLPSVPTLAEAGVRGLEVTAWFGAVAPRGVPPDIVARLNAGVRKAVASGRDARGDTAQGFEPMANSPEEFAALIRATWRSGRGWPRRRVQGRMSV